MNFHPQSHDCHSAVAKMRKEYGEKVKRDLSIATSWLAACSWYEALHVACSGEFNPVCPQCGTAQEGFTNPVIAYLMEKYPHETTQWSAEHKGFLLCDNCFELLP